MNRNTQAHFANIPSVSIGRSKFDRSFTHKTSFSTGELVPLFVDPDIVPGDSVTMNMSEVIRMCTPLAPAMDNLIFDVYWFFVPNRLVMTDWAKLMGENTSAPWTQETDVTIPQLKITSAYKNSTTNLLTTTVVKGSVLEKMGIPPTNWNYATGDNEKKIQISALPVRSYCLCWNEFFRDENLQNPLNIPKNNAIQNVVNKNVSSYIDDPYAYTISNECYGGLPPVKACKTHDVFTSCLPGVQKGPAVSLPLTNDPEDGYVKLKGYSGSTTGIDGKRAWINAEYNSGTLDNDLTLGYLDPTSGTNNVPAESFNTYLYVDLEHATGATISQLRQAFAIQKFYERDARGGTRYIESIWSHFGVRNPDFRLQRPEYLGGFRMHINQNQVVQNSSTDEVTPLGYTGAYSVTTGSNGRLFSHSFTEHGCLLCLGVIRIQSHTYSQGINRAWFKKKRLDFYSPEFANLSETGVLQREIYVTGDEEEDQKAFGYNEAWYEMRYMPDMCTGLMRPDDPTGEPSLGDIWTYGDYYTETPKLGNKWIQEGKTEVQRTLAIEEYDQFWADFYFNAIYTRPMPLYSIPGLIDHH